MLPPNFPKLAATNNAHHEEKTHKKARSRVQFPPTWDNVLVVKFSAQQLHRVEHERKREVLILSIRR
jgi:hypothetical protein